MKKKNTNANPNFQKIVVKVSKTETSTKDLLDFEFLDNDGNTITINEIFDKMLNLETRLKTLEDKHKVTK